MKRIQVMLTFVLTIIIGLFIYSQIKLYNDIEEKIKTELLSYNDLFYSTSFAKLHEIETILDLIGAQLIFQDTYKDAEKTTELLSLMKTRVDNSVGLGFIKPEGDYLALSSNIDIKKVKGLHEQEATKDSFALTLKSDVMVAGRVYFFPASQEWVLPLRKAVRSSSGEIIGVVATALILDESTGFINESKLYTDQISMLVNVNNLYRVYVNPLEKGIYEEIYSYPIPREAIELISMENEVDLEELREYNESALYGFESQINNEIAMGAARYLGRYDLWVVSLRPTNYPMREFLEGGIAFRVFLFSVVVVIVIVLFMIIFKKEEEIKKNLAFKAKHDFLTGLYNRNVLDELADKWMEVNAPSFILIFIDLDNFKNINDAFGHSCGDVVLQQVAERLRNLLPKEAELVRHGGDEFSIFLNSENFTSIDLIGESIVKNLSESYHVSGMKLHIGASVGISRFPHDGTTMEQLMIAADLAMYDAKKKKNSYAIYNEELKNLIHKKINIEHELRHALQNGDELYMVYQPQISNSGTIHGCEALVRWENSKLGFIPPNEFVSVAEESGLIEPLGIFILERSCAEFSNMLQSCDEAHTVLNLSINISVKQILEENFKETLLEIMKKYDIKPNQITLEITESLFIDNLEYVLPLLYDIRKTKVMISLDDFGTGYSSLSMLRTLPIDELKIDKSFIDNICNIEQDAKMVNSIIDMGHNMEMYLVSEGVEDESQLNVLQKYGCDCYQGYYFSKPLRANDFIEFVKKYKKK